MPQLTLTSKLDAVNVLLTSVGEDPVNQLGSGLEDASAAENILDEVSRRVQTQGWEWNTESNYPLKRQADGTINLAQNILSVDFNNRLYTRRGLKVYDKANHTYQFTKDITGTVIVGLDFEELPEEARQYIAYSAGRVFQDRRLGSQVVHAFTEIDEQNAWIMLRQKDEANADRSIFDNYELQVMLDRSPATPAYHFPAGSIIGGIY